MRRRISDTDEQKIDQARGEMAVTSATRLADDSTMRRAASSNGSSSSRLGETDQIAAVDDLAAVRGKRGPAARGLRSPPVERLISSRHRERRLAVVGGCRFVARAWMS